MQSGEESLAWVSLTRAPALDAAAVSRALQLLGTAQHMVRASSAAYARAGLPAAAGEFLSGVHAAPTAAERAWLDDPHHHIVPFTDPHYPALLRTAQRHPLALYVAGNPGVLNDPQLAIVGSRNPSPQGSATSQEFAEYLAARGLAITSGLAVGIDSAAHRGALKAQGVTLAVLGSGADVIYPPANRSLAHEIRQAGALVSTFPLGAPPAREHFPQRNALIAGLRLGTLVVEAARRSGSLITARLASDFGRELFAIPGSIHNPLSRGCHELIRQGAKLTETAHDILSELNFSAFFAHVQTAAGAAASGSVLDAPGGSFPASGMDKEHKILLDALGFDPADLDVLVVRTGFKPEAVSSMMLILELEGHVQAAPGGRYSRVVRSRR
jgi:DNA processing protein